MHRAHDHHFCRDHDDDLFTYPWPACPVQFITSHCCGPAQRRPSKLVDASRLASTLRWQRRPRRETYHRHSAPIPHITRPCFPNSLAVRHCQVDQLATAGTGLLAWTGNQTLELQQTQVAPRNTMDRYQPPPSHTYRYS